MRAVRVLASLAVGVLVASASPSVSEGRREGSPEGGAAAAAAGAAGAAGAGAAAGAAGAAAEAVEGLQSVEKLLSLLGDSSVSEEGRIDISLAFISSMIRMLHPDAAAAERLVQAVEEAVQLDSSSSRVLSELEQLKQQLQGGVEKEEEERLRGEVRRLLQQLAAVSKRSVSLALQTASLSPDGFEGTPERKAFAELLAELYFAAVSSKYKPFA